MPVHTNSIGAHTFFDLDGPIEVFQQQLEIIERPGVAGTGARRLSTRGLPCQLRSINYVADFEAAQENLRLYADEVGQAPVAVTRNSIYYGTFLVEHVSEATPPQAVFNVAGGNGEEVRQEITWQLRHITDP